ncbi:hypothetical protein [Micromonospora sp. CMU55-4]|uniref:hypothetical protein n=1 Tax=Micromonospora sp. CMU55-4 TaxID=2717028 RepID=UPI0014087D8E|nr:hypothetical protein [Micromonospora sp. CMU55-4]NHO85178.1 hypothetical protein [Micromonospora sp. CMU55-4]
MVIKSEEDVKKVLDIDTWRNLSKDKVFQLVAMMPEMEKEVQLKIIEQLPEITKLAVKAMITVRKVHESTLSSNEKSQENVHRGYRETRAAIIAQLQRDDLDPETRRYLNELLMQTADKESAKDSENKHFLDRWVNKTTLGVAAAAIVLTAVATGGKVALQNGDALRKP